MAAERANTSWLAMPRTRFVVAGIAALLLFIGWQLWNLEWIEQQSDPFFSDTANQKPYLAAQLFLQRLGHTVSEGDNEDALEQLPEGRAVLVLASGRAHLSEQQQQVLLDWINNGGHLVTLATREWNDKTESIDDLLQRQFAVAAVRTGDSGMELVSLLFQNGGDDTTDDVEVPAEPDAPAGDDQVDAASVDGSGTDAETVVMSDEQCLAQPPLGTTEIDWSDGQRLVADIGGQLRMEVGDVEPTLSAADPLGLQLVQFGFGLGKITFLTSMNLWKNHQIDNVDNAHLLALLVDDAERIVILHNFDAVPLTELLRHYFPATLIMLVVLIIMVIHHHQLRWGAVIGSGMPPRRSLLQHISASGRFLWQHQQLAPLVKRLQQQITDQMTRLHHNQTIERDELLNQLAVATGIGRERVRRAMGDTATDELLDQIRLLQTIRNSL